VDLKKCLKLANVLETKVLIKSITLDFTSLEFYWAYSNYKDLMKLTEKLFSVLMKNVFGSLKIKHNDKEIDFKAPWQRIEFSQLLKNTPK